MVAALWSMGSYLSDPRTVLDTSEELSEEPPALRTSLVDLLTLRMGESCSSPHDFILGGIQVLDQKVCGHFSFPFHFNLSSLDNVKPFVFQGSRQREEKCAKYQRSQTSPGPTAEEEGSEVTSSLLGHQGEGLSGEGGRHEGPVF